MNLMPQSRRQAARDWWDDRFLVAAGRQDVDYRDRWVCVRLFGWQADVAFYAGRSPFLHPDAFDR